MVVDKVQNAVIKGNLAAKREDHRQVIHLILDSFLKHLTHLRIMLLIMRIT